MQDFITARRYPIAASAEYSLANHSGLATKILLSLVAFAAVAPAQGQPRAYVSTGDSLAVVDTATNTLGGVLGPLLTAGRRPAALSPDGALAYVPSGTFYPADVPGFVSVTNTATNVVAASVQVGGRPMAVALTPDGAFAYVANQGSGTVSVIDTASHGVVAVVNVGPSPSSVAISPDGAFAYVANGGIFGTVSVISTATHTVDAVVPVSPLPSDLAVTPDGARVYVVGGFGELSIIDTATRALLETRFLVTVAKSVALSPDGAFAYLLSNSDLSVIDTSTNLLTGNVREGGCDVALTPDGGFVYITDPSAGVDVLDAATLARVATIAGAGGCGIAMTPVDGTSASDVAIEVRGGQMNPKSNQKVPVAVLTTETFDALQIDPSSVGFGPAQAPSHHRGGHAADVDGDGDVDLLFHFDIRATGIECGDTEATFVGETYGSDAVTATASIRTVQCR